MTSRFRTLARKVLAIVAAGCALAALTGQFGRWSERLDAVNLFLPYILGAGILAAVAVLAIDRRRHRAGWGAWGALAVMVAGPIPLVLRELWPAPASAPCAGETLRIVQFNAWKENDRSEAAARWIRASGADLVLLEEARSHVALPALLRADYPYQQSCVGESFCTTTILSRRRPLASGGLARGDPENRGALSAAWMRVTAGQRPFTVVVAHLGRPWPFARFQGDRVALERFVRTLPRDGMVIGGDFNLPGWTFQLGAIDRAFGIERRTRALLSWPATVHRWRVPTPLLGIDHLFAGAEWQVEDLRRGPFLGSDHYPVVADLRRCADRQAMAQPSEGTRRSASSGTAAGRLAEPLLRA